MPTIVDMRPSANTFRHATLIVIWLVVQCLHTWNNTIDLSCEDFFKMKQFVQTGSKLQAVKHVKESAKCGLKEAKDFVDTYCDYVL